MARRSKRKKDSMFILILALISLVLMIYLPSFYLQYRDKTSTKGYVEMNVGEITYLDEGAAIELVGGCREFSFYASESQGQSIEEGLRGEIAYRPLTHDVIESIINRYGIRPMMVKVTKLSDNTYFAEMTFQRLVFQFLTLDLRPSDAIGIAVRTNSPIYINENLTRVVC